VENQVEEDLNKTDRITALVLMGRASVLLLCVPLGVRPSSFVLGFLTGAARKSRGASSPVGTIASRRNQLLNDLA